MALTCTQNCILQIGVLWIVLHTFVNIEASEYCSADAFSPSCGLHEVIMMTQAHYGHMELGKCIELDLGFLGCSTDVLSWMDQMCSGRERCDITIPNDELNALSKCQKELTQYLEADYTCKPVLDPPSTDCTRMPSMSVTSEPSYITSTSSIRSACGLSEAPWNFQAKQGQQVNLTLIDFNWSTLDTGSRDQTTCKMKYGHIVDAETNNYVMICGGTKRKRWLYLSKGSIVQVILDRAAVKKYNFLVEYRALGCPDFTPPQDAWVRKEDDRLVIGCHGSRKTWDIVCKGDIWTGFVGRCNQEDFESGISDRGQKKPALPNVISLTLIASVTLVLCCVSVTCITVCYCMRKSKLLRKENQFHPLKPLNTATLPRNATLLSGSSIPIKLRPQARESRQNFNSTTTRLPTFPQTHQRQSTLGSIGSAGSGIYDDPTNLIDVTERPQNVPDETLKYQPLNKSQAIYQNL